MEVVVVLQAVVLLLEHLHSLTHLFDHKYLKHKRAAIVMVQAWANI